MRIACCRILGRSRETFISHLASYCIKKTMGFPLIRFSVKARDQGSYPKLQRSLPRLYLSTLLHIPISDTEFDKQTAYFTIHDSYTQAIENNLDDGRDRLGIIQKKSTQRAIQLPNLCQSIGNQFFERDDMIAQTHRRFSSKFRQ